MIILGLTGSIAMGKSTAAAMLRRLGVPVYDADRTVHRLLAKGGKAVDQIAAVFPGVVRDDAIDHQQAARRVFGDERALKQLEGILHPLVSAEQNKFLAAAARRGESLVVLDIPLLLETGGDAHCDAVAVVSATARVQGQRLMQRPGLTEARIEAIRARQMSDARKRRRADFVIPTGLGRAFTLRALQRMLRTLKETTGTKWAPNRLADGRNNRPPHRC